MTLEMISSVSLPVRENRGHKGTFGSVGVIGGSVGERMMVGGPAFTAEAALRSGCGLAILAAPAPLMTGNNLGIADCGFVASFAIIALLQDVLDLPVRLPPSIADYASALAAHPSVMKEHARYQGALGAWADGKLRG